MHPVEFERKRRGMDDVELRHWAEQDFEAYCRLLAPTLMLGEIHVEWMTWMARDDRRLNTLTLLPRGHLKSRLMAMRCSWYITVNPIEMIIYMSATMNLAEKQLGLVKQVLTSKMHRKLWPELINPDETKRKRWTTTEIIVDHPLRAKELTRDATFTCAGLTSNVTGLHATRVVLDDIVVPGNAYTNEGRTRVANAVSQVAAIKEPDCPTEAVGTRYHPEDIYNTMMEQTYEVWNEETDEYLGEEPLYDVFLRQVEVDGEFLWPRVKRPDGKWFGFNRSILSKVRGEYSNPVHFYANYYNEPNDLESEQIASEYVQEFESEKLRWRNDRLHYEERRLNVFAAIDFAFSRSKKADFTALVVVGIDYENNVYVLDIHRFKTDKISGYFEAIEESWLRWRYRKLRAEVTVAQQTVVKELKDNYIKPAGLFVSIDEYRPNRHEGDKRERIMGVLEPRYSNYQVWHSDQLRHSDDLIAELILENAPTDDVANALADAIDVSTPPARPRMSGFPATGSRLPINSRFGGVSYGR